MLLNTKTPGWWQQIGIVCVLLALLIIDLCNGATTHKHDHLNKERVEDGGYPIDGRHRGNRVEHHVEFDHEAILGSIKEAEEFDSLSPEESKKRLAVLVTKMDLNADKFVDRHELKAWILRSFRSLSEEEGNERFTDVDENEDGEVTFQEYIKDTYGIEDEINQRDPIESPQAFEEAKALADDRVMFNASDVNRDGKLTIDEFIVFIIPEEHQHMLPIILQQTLRDKDKNGDGKIDFQEFTGDSTDRDKEWLLTEKDRFDNNYDLDGDRALNGNEILSWIVPSNEQIAEDEVDHLFASSDANHDDRLAYQEIINNYDTFVGSEATDYGDHLQNIEHFNDEL